MQPRWALPAIVLMALAADLTCFNSLQVGQHVDDASYVVLGQALAAGQGYRMVCYPGAPYESKYPPLLPWLIALCFRLFGEHLWVARLPALVAALLAIPVLWALLRRFLDGWALWLLVALVALHPMVVGYAGMAMTEAPSLLLTWLALLLVLRSGERREEGQVVALGLTLGLGLLLRTDMVALAAAVPLALLLQRRPREAIIVLFFAVAPLVPWLSFAREYASGGDGYLGEVARGWWDPSPWPLRLWHGFTAYAFGYIPEQVTLVFGSVVESAARAHGLAALVTALQVVVGLVVLIGFARSWRTLPLVITLFIAIRLAVLLGFCPVSRYVLPMLPFLVVCLVLGLVSWRRPGREPRIGRPLALTCGLLLLPALARDGLLLVCPPSRQYPDVVAGGALIRDNTPPNAVIACTWSSKSFYLYGQRLVEELPLLRAVTINDVMGTRHATHLLVVQTAAGRTDLRLLRASPCLRPVAQDEPNHMWLFRIVGSPAAGTAGDDGGPEG